MKQKSQIIANLVTKYLPSDYKGRTPVILDVGCGDGSTVRDLRNEGYDAYGCDVEFKNKADLARTELLERGYVRQIGSGANQQLPFKDNQADLVYSDQVIEHVEDLDSFFQEVARVCKPEGVSFHYFPSNNKPLEPHVNIPLATKIQNKKWIHFWKHMPVPNIPRTEWGRRGVDSIHNYLHHKTHYRTSPQIYNLALTYFQNVFWDPDTLLRSMNFRKTAQMIRAVPGGPWLFNALWSKILVCKEPL
ncbi:class I SAM-dependent methyltransferase [Halorhodospira sp. M38]|nr:class I SAM-dependent methyltransferase [Halorhodospira sp. M39old]MCG5546882.1 class I SAM-dependent methyltransferase [Halorhodospira sp. M38]